MTTTPTLPDLDPLTQATIDLASAVLDSADIEVIGKSDWYSRAQAALETAAAGSQSTAEAVTTMGRKLQIYGALDARSSETVTRVAPVIDAHWNEWVEKVARESTYLIALTRMTRNARRATKKEN